MPAGYISPNFGALHGLIWHLDNGMCKRCSFYLHGGYVATPNRMADVAIAGERTECTRYALFKLHGGSGALRALSTHDSSPKKLLGHAGSESRWFYCR